MLTGLASGAGARFGFGEQWEESLGCCGQARHGDGGPLFRGRRPLPGAALIEFDVGLELAEEG